MKVQEYENEEKRKQLNLDSEKTIERPVDVEVSKEGRVEFEEKEDWKKSKFKPKDALPDLKTSDNLAEKVKKKLDREERDKRMGITYENGGQQFCPVAKAEMTDEEKEEAERSKRTSERETAILNSPENVGNFSTEIQSREQMMKLAVFLVNNGLVPSTFKKVNEVVMAIQTAMSLGYSRFGSISLAIKNMYIINNSVNLWGELPMAIINRSGKLDFMEEYFLNKEGKEISEKNNNLQDERKVACCRIKRVDRSNIQSFYLTVDDLRIAGVTPKKDGGFIFGKSTTWARYPKIHWIRRNRAFALKSVFPEFLTGIEILEYDGLKYAKASKNEEYRKQIEENLI